MRSPANLSRGLLQERQRSSPGRTRCWKAQHEWLRGHCKHYDNAWSKQQFSGACSHSHTLKKTRGPMPEPYKTGPSRIRYNKLIVACRALPPAPYATRKAGNLTSGQLLFIEAHSLAAHTPECKLSWRADCAGMAEPEERTFTMPWWQVRIWTAAGSASDTGLASSTSSCNVTMLSSGPHPRPTTKPAHTFLFPILLNQLRCPD